MTPSRKKAQQIASVGMVSSRVEQASASAARIQSANRMRIAAGIRRQSTPGAKGGGLAWLGKKLETTKAMVTINVRLNTASETKGRLRKKLLKPPRRYAITRERP